VGEFPLDAYGSPIAIAVDSTGAVYAVGTPVSGFQATPGAYQTAAPSSACAVTEGYVLKIAPALDRAVYASLLYQGELVGNTSGPAALATDSEGNAYVGGSFYPCRDEGVPMKQIGLAPTAGVAYVVKLNPQGTAAVWSDGLASGSVDWLAVLPDGRARVLVSISPVATRIGYGPWSELGEALFTVNSDGAAIENSNFLGGLTAALNDAAFGKNGFLSPGAAGPVGVLVTTNSGRFPVIFDDQAARPLLVGFSDRQPQADLSLSVRLARPYVFGNDTLRIRLTVTNNGPDDAEGVRLRASVTGNNNDGTMIGCVPGWIAICNAAGGAVIPVLPAGATTDVEIFYTAHCYATAPADCSPSAYAQALALTSDSNLANNSATLAVPVTIGYDAPFDSSQFYLKSPLAYYRSDVPTSAGTSVEMNPPTADPSLTVWVPTQTSAGNVWYLDSWGDGNRDNPRIFDASQGISAAQGHMNFRATSPLGADPGSLDLVAMPGSAPIAQAVTIHPTTHTGTWSVGQPGVSWLTLSLAASGGGDGSIEVTGTADVSSLAPGYYTTTFSVKLVAAGYPDVSMDIPASVCVLDKAPVIQSSGFVNAASYQIGPPSSRQIITIFGSGLGPPQLVTAFVPQAGSLPTTLAGTSVEFQGAAAELLYVQDQSVAAILSSEVYGSSGTLTIKLGGTPGPSVSIPAPPYGPGVNGSSLAPGLFTSDSSGSGTLAAVNADGTVNSPLHPAGRGSVVLVYGTGFSISQQCSMSGFGLNSDFGFLFPGSTLFPGMPSPPEAFVGGQPAYVLYSGSAPGMTCGAQQFNILIPNDSATGPVVPFQMGIPARGSSPTDPYVWYTSQPGTTLAIQ
jgi:uncharacterized protein (TIGR03437 family)